jgi:hypothetical protein
VQKIPASVSLGVIDRQLYSVENWTMAIVTTPSPKKLHGFNRAKCFRIYSNYAQKGKQIIAECLSGRFPTLTNTVMCGHTLITLHNNSTCSHSCTDHRNVLQVLALSDLLLNFGWSKWSLTLVGVCSEGRLKQFSTKPLFSGIMCWVLTTQFNTSNY